MRTLLTLTAVVVVVAGLAALGLAACGGADAGGPPDELDCVQPLRLGDRAYRGTEVRLRRALPPVERQVTLTVARCDGGQEEERTADVRQGIPASIAVFADDEGGTEAGQRTVVQLASDAPLGAGHPMHAWIEGGPAPRGCRGVPAEPVRGRVAALFPWLEVESRAGNRLRLEIDPSIRIAGPEVDGVPRVPAGARVELRHRACRSAAPHLVAIRVLDRDAPAP